MEKRKEVRGSVTSDKDLEEHLMTQALEKAEES